MSVHGLKYLSKFWLQKTHRNFRRKHCKREKERQHDIRIKNRTRKSCYALKVDMYVYDKLFSESQKYFCILILCTVTRNVWHYIVKI